MANLAPHETLELHELLSSDSAQIKKLSSIISNIRDQELKTYLDTYLNFKKDNFEAIEKLLDNISKMP